IEQARRRDARRQRSGPAAKDGRAPVKTRFAQAKIMNQITHRVVPVLLDRNGTSSPSRRSETKVRPCCKRWACSREDEIRPGENYEPNHTSSCAGAVWSSVFCQVSIARVKRRAFRGSGVSQEQALSHS